MLPGVTMLAIRGGKRLRNRAATNVGEPFFLILIHYVTFHKKLNADPFCGLLGQCKKKEQLDHL